jgi:hypothetical protein
VNPVLTNKLGTVVYHVTATWEALVGELWSKADPAKKRRTLSEKQPEAKSAGDVA